MYTRDHFQEVRPGLWKLEGYHLFVWLKGYQETCEACGGKGKLPTVAASGRESWGKCYRCKGTGNCIPLENVRPTVPKTGQSTQTMVCSWEEVIDSLNGTGDRSCFGWLDHPTYIKII